MLYLSLENDDGIQATAEIDDAIWNDNRGSIERAAAAAGYSIRCDHSGDGLYPNKACHSLAEVANWIAETAQWV